MRFFDSVNLPKASDRKGKAGETRHRSPSRSPTIATGWQGPRAAPNSDLWPSAAMLSYVVPIGDRRDTNEHEDSALVEARRYARTEGYLFTRLPPGS